MSCIDSLTDVLFFLVWRIDGMGPVVDVKKGKACTAHRSPRQPYSLRRLAHKSREQNARRTDVSEIGEDLAQGNLTLSFGEPRPGPTKGPSVRALPSHGTHYGTESSPSGARVGTASNGM